MESNNTSIICYGGGGFNGTTTCNATTTTTTITTTYIDIRTIWWLDIIMNILGLFFHALGIYAVQKGDKKSNQRVILTSLSIVEMVGALYMLINDVIRLVRYREDMFHTVENMETVLANRLPPIYHEISFCIYFAAAFEILLVFLVMILDRLACSLNPYAYRMHVTRERLTYSICISCVVSLILGLVYSLVPRSKFIVLALFLVAALVQLILTVITYIIVGQKINKSMRTRSRSSQSSQRSGGGDRENSRLKKHQLIPGLIVLTYFIFYLIPLSVQQFVLRRKVLTPRICIIHEGLSIFLDFGILSDALIYVFLNKNCRNRIKKDFGSCCGCIGGGTDSQSQHAGVTSTVSTISMVEISRYR